MDHIPAHTENPNPITKKDVVWIFTISIAVFVVDVITKIWAAHSLQGNPPIHIVPGFLRLLYGENTGIAFGLLQDYGGILHILAPIAFVVLLIIVYKQISELDMDWWYVLMFGLLIGGALGNILNRLYSGYVVDFIDVYYQDFQWPTFNVADSALTVGEVILVFKLVFWKKPAEESSAENPSSISETNSQ